METPVFLYILKMGEHSAIKLHRMWHGTGLRVRIDFNRNTNKTEIEHGHCRLKWLAWKVRTDEIKSVPNNMIKAFLTIKCLIQSDTIK